MKGRVVIAIAEEGMQQQAALENQEMTRREASQEEKVVPVQEVDQLVVVALRKVEVAPISD